jgi:beta-lactamase superfamily II metal-dependent hydrolase
VTVLKERHWLTSSDRGWSGIIISERVLIVESLWNWLTVPANSKKYPASRAVSLEPEELGMFSIELLPAGRGDCILLEYGDPARPSRVLIDGGPKPCFPALRQRILAIPEGKRRFDLLVVTHVDADHIGGVLELLRERAILGVDFDDVWFNGFRHLPAPGSRLGPIQGEELTCLLVGQDIPWNRAFSGERVAVPDSGALPTCALAGGMKLTLLSPTPELLGRLWPRWDEVIETAGLTPSSAGQPEDETTTVYGILAPGLDIDALAAVPFQPDRSQANGSSIAFLAEFEGRRCLLTGDAFPATLDAAIRRLFDAAGAGRLLLDAFKPSHHGSRGSLSAELLKLLRCNRYLISTDGSYFQHPHGEAIARTIVHGGERPGLCFNYRNEYTSPWADADLIREHGYEVVYPPPGTRQGLRLEL